MRPQISVCSLPLLVQEFPLLYGPECRVAPCSRPLQTLSRLLICPNSLWHSGSSAGRRIMTPTTQVITSLYCGITLSVYSLKTIQLSTISCNCTHPEGEKATMAIWRIYQGTGVPHDGIARLPEPPPWRRFDGDVPVQETMPTSRPQPTRPFGSFTRGQTFQAS